MPPARAILALQHVPHEALGTIEAAFTGAGLACRYVDLWREIPQRLQLEQAAGLVLLGGPMNVHETGKYPFLEPELAWTRQAIEAGLPVLGICLGSQLMAKALGAKVAANAVKEIGWYDVELSCEAASDPLFAGCSRKLTIFQWHGDRFELPAGAVRLARGDACENQAFRYGDRAYALQFHLEMTAAMVEDWLNDPVNRRELAALDYIDSQVIRERAPQELTEMQAVAAQVFGRFAAICREPAYSHERAGPRAAQSNPPGHAAI
jgi:GMP synthase (glutamine-hydrolysing)